MADPWAQFPDAPQQTQGDPWAQFPDAQPAQAAQPQEQPQRPAGDPLDVITEPAMAIGSGLGASVVGGLSGLGTMGARALGLTNADPAEVTRRVSERLTYQPRTVAGGAATDAATYPFRKFAEFADETIAGSGRPRVSFAKSPQQQARDMTAPSPGEQTAAYTISQAVPALMLRGRANPAEVARNARTPAPRRPAVPDSARTPDAVPTGRKAGPEVVPPTVEELAAQSRAAYKRASDAGANITPDSFARLKNRIGVLLNKEGLDPTLHPQATAAFKRIADTKGVVPLEQLETLRRIANDAKGAGKADGQKAALIVEHIDDYLENIGRKDLTSGDPKGAAALREARSLWSRKAKAEEIQNLIERAEISAQQFSGSGLENAIRVEFRALAKNQKRMRRFTAEEQAAIKKVAMGGTAENILRFFGKAAPTGIVSSALSGGLGALIGGGPGAVALPALGFASRQAATRMTVRNATRAAELMRRGPQKSKGPQTRRTPLREGA